MQDIQDALETMSVFCLFESILDDLLLLVFQHFLLKSVSTFQN